MAAGFPRLGGATIRAGLAVGAGMLLCASVNCAQQPSAAPARAALGPLTLAFTGVTVIDVTDGRLLPQQTVVLTGNRIAAVGPAPQVLVPSGAQVIDARGKYLIPGLWDMHAHTEFPGSDDIALQDSIYRQSYPVYVANGVTGIREMAQRFPNGADSFRVWQRAVLAGQRVGPRAVGPSADLSYELEIATPEDARRIVDSLQAAGDAFVKYHGEPDARDPFFALAREARRVGLPLVGHVSALVTNVEAADSGQSDVEHAAENRQCSEPDDSMQPWDSAAEAKQCGPVATAYLRNGTWITPTLVVYHYAFKNRDDVIREMTRVVQILHHLGVQRILAGTDCAAEVLQSWGVDPVCHRGVSLLEELVWLVGAGLTPLEALQAATLNPAKSLHGTDSLGTVAPGKVADLVLLDADPLVDMRNVMKIRAVVANGRYFERAALEAMDPEGVLVAKGYLDQQAQAGKIGGATP